MHEHGMSGGNERTGVGDAMDRRVMEALERVPAVDISADFAARVSGQVTARSEVAVTGSRYGWMAARIAMAVLSIAIVVVAMLASGRTVLGITLEWILCGELVGLSMWMSGLWRVSGSEA